MDFEVKGYVAKEGDDADEVIEKKYESMFSIFHLIYFFLSVSIAIS